MGGSPGHFLSPVPANTSTGGSNGMEQILALPGSKTDTKEKDFTFSFEESVGWTNFLYSTLEPFV